MTKLRDGWNSQLASDIVRDGMGLELVNSEGDVVAEIFRSDSARSILVSTFNNDIPLEIFDLYYQEALNRLDPFEDGLSFVSAGIIKG